MLPLNCCTDGSILFSPIKPSAMAAFLAEHEEYKTLPLTDFGNLSQVVPYYEAITKAERKPIIGVQLLVEDKWLTIYAQNKNGWHNLLALVHSANLFNKESPQLKLVHLSDMNLSNLICLAGDGIKEDEQKLLAALFPHYFFVNSGLKQNWSLYKEDLELVEQLLLKQFNNINDCPDYSNNYLFNNPQIGPNKLADEIYELIEHFDITEPQVLPKFPCGEEEIEHLTKLCAKALEERGLSNQYKERLNHELNVIRQADMAGYFLVVGDIVQFLKKKGREVGVGRGSAAGCLISYLIGITNVDPLQYNLLFERFYSADRGGLPDIDIDIPPDSRPSVVDYVQIKYGKEKFGQLATFGTLKGRAGLQLTLKNSGVKFGESSRITETLPEEAKVDPKLKDQKDEFGTKSLVLYALRKQPKQFKDWCQLKISKDKKLEFSGKYAKAFELAVRLDGTYASRGRHASAFVLSDKALHEQAPVVWDSKSKEWIVGVEMNSSESLGLVKIDLLGLDCLSKYEYTKQVLEDGSIIRKVGDYKKC